MKTALGFNAQHTGVIDFGSGGGMSLPERQETTFREEGNALRCSHCSVLFKYGLMTEKGDAATSFYALPFYCPNCGCMRR
jgi:hypothetical protein